MRTPSAIRPNEARHLSMPMTKAPATCAFRSICMYVYIDLYRFKIQKTCWRPKIAESTWRYLFRLCGLFVASSHKAHFSSKAHNSPVVETVCTSRTMKTCTFALLSALTCLAAPFASGQSLAPSAADSSFDSLAPSSASSISESLVPTEFQCLELNGVCTDTPCCEGLTCTGPFNDGRSYCAPTRRLRGAEEWTPPQE